MHPITHNCVELMASWAEEWVVAEILLIRALGTRSGIASAKSEGFPPTGLYHESTLVDYHFSVAFHSFKNGVASEVRVSSGC